MNFNRIYPGVMRALERVARIVAVRRKAADVDCPKSPVEEEAQIKRALRAARDMAEEERKR